MLTRSDLIDERNTLQQQLRQHRKNLFRLQEQQAMYGISVPLEILNQIDQREEQIAQISTRLTEIEAELERLPEEAEAKAAPAASATAPSPQMPEPAGPTTAQPTVFISYSHKDEAEKEALVAHLGVLQRAGLIETWVDDRIGAGSDWAADIDRAMSGAKVAILLVTANFLTSEFILNTEVPRLLERRKTEGVVVFPVIAKPCAWSRVDWLAKMNVRPKNGTPVWREGGRYVDEELATIAEEVAKIIEQAGQASQPAPVASTPGSPPIMPVQPPSPAKPITADAPTPSQPAGRERAWIPFKMQLARPDKLAFEVRAFKTPMGEPHATGQVPYDAADLITILKLLERGGYAPEHFNDAQTETLQRLGLLQDRRLIANYLPQLGLGLYQALFPDQVGTAFQVAFNQSRNRRDTIALQLRFDSNTVDLARYPWELLHDGHRHLLAGGVVELARYIAYPEATTTLPAAPPWRLLYIAARPQDLDTLPDEAERLAVWQGLDSMSKTGKLILDRLDPPTYEALLDRTAGDDYHIIHFDGHGVFARRCPQCGTMHYPHLSACVSCGTPLDEVRPLGYLAFENDSGEVDYVSTEAMENLLLNSEVRLVFLSACQSSVVRGESLFGGLAPGLIRAGVPAVVAMQFSVPVKGAISFATGFYQALAQGQAVSRAVAQGRRRLFRDNTWFIPTLYLRSSDDEGRLFVE